MLKIITREDLHSLLTFLSSDFEIIGPQELSLRGIFYKPIADIKDLYWGEDFTVEPVKKFFLCPSERLFKRRYDNNNEALEDPPLPGNKRIIVGVRPCEAAGLALLDKVFNEGQYKDEFYLNNRKRTVLVGLSCSKPDSSCFCTSLDGSPVNNRGMDALMSVFGNEFIIEIISDIAKKIFGSRGRDLTKEETEAFKSGSKKTKESLKLKIKPPENMDAAFENDYWKRISQPCINCGVCTFLCPTCHCFDLVDEKRGMLRCYDGCAFCDFTMEASGVNPRLGKGERYRQRVYHKFDYFKKNFKENLCVGCGRCIRFCPVKMNIAEIVDKAPLNQ